MKLQKDENPIWFFQKIKHCFRRIHKNGSFFFFSSMERRQNQTKRKVCQKFIFMLAFFSMNWWRDVFAHLSSQNGVYWIKKTLWHAKEINLFALQLSRFNFFILIFLAKPKTIRFEIKVGNLLRTHVQTHSRWNSFALMTSTVWVRWRDLFYDSFFSASSLGQVLRNP